MKTNFDVCCESVEMMAQMIDIMKCGWTKEQIVNWLKQPFVEKEEKRSKYKPKVVEGRISGTGWPVDGHTLMLSSWNYDNHENWHLDYWKAEEDSAVMETMFISETTAGLCLYDTLEEFAEHWEEWEPEGSFCIPLENVETVKVLQEEVKIE